MFEQTYRVLRRIFEPKMEELREVGENYITRSFIICTLNLTILG
jgi:hypothetical protein